MPQPPPQPAPTGFHSRAMTPVRNPIYITSDDASFKQSMPQARHVLDPGVPPGTDPRLTVQGSVPPVAGLTPIVPFAGQTPWNVWGLSPA